uniref:Uncharacterized protein n=1 Tax=Anopheles atroparvus TaxID=41427 RepID=A0AAG5D0K1_ANOAO
MCFRTVSQSLMSLSPPTKIFLSDALCEITSRRDLFIFAKRYVKKKCVVSCTFPGILGEFCVFLIASPNTWIVLFIDAIGVIESSVSTAGI